MRSPIVTAFLNPINLAMLALAVAAGLCAAWWLFPVGLLVWGVMVLVIAYDPSLRFNQEIESRAPLAMRFDARFKQIQRSQVSLYNKLQAAKPASRSALQPLREAINTLTERTFQVCLRMSALENHRMVTQRTRNLTEEMALINARIIASNDPKVKQEYEDSRQAVQTQINKMSAMASLLDRFEAQLMSLSSTLDGIITETVHLQTMKPDAIQNELPALLQNIRDQADQLRDFEEQASVPQS